MHELSIALNLLDIVAEEAERRGGVDVVAIHVQLGQLSGVVPEALESAFALARETTAFPDCRLEIQEVAVRVFCPACGVERPVEAIYCLKCVECGMASGRITGGQELEVTAMEIVDNEEERGARSKPPTSKEPPP